MHSHHRVISLSLTRGVSIAVARWRSCVASRVAAGSMVKQSRPYCATMASLSHSSFCCNIACCRVESNAHRVGHGGGGGVSRRPPRAGTQRVVLSQRNARERRLLALSRVSHRVMGMDASIAASAGGVNKLLGSGGPPLSRFGIAVVARNM